MPGVSNWLRVFWDVLGTASKNVVSCWQEFPAGGSHRLSREAPFTQVLVYSQRRADRREGRCTHRFARKRTEPARMLFGHDESLPHWDNGTGKDRCGGVVLRGQGKDRIFTAEYGRGRCLLARHTRFANRVAALAGWSGEGTSETVRIIPLVRRVACVLIESPSG